MSITKATSNVSTSWTEQNPVAFAAGTLGNMGLCEQEVQTKLKRGTINHNSTPTAMEVRQWLIYGKQQLCEEFGFTWKMRYAYMDTSDGVYRNAMPPDYAGGKVRVRDMTNDRQLTSFSPSDYDLKWPDPSEEGTNKPEIFTVKRMELWLMPPPPASTRLEIEYERSGDDGTPMDVDYLPELMRFKICNFAIYQAFASLHMWQEAQLYKAEWEMGIQKSKRADSRKKWATAVRAKMWMEEYAAKFNQS